MLSSVYGVWCGALLVDLVVQNVFDAHVKETFQDTMHSLISCLRRQTNLKIEMGTVCPITLTTRWISLGLACRWFVNYRRNIMAHVAKKNPTICPQESWWILVHLVA